MEDWSGLREHCVRREQSLWKYYHPQPKVTVSDYMKDDCLTLNMFLLGFGHAPLRSQGESDPGFSCHFANMVARPEKY